MIQGGAHNFFSYNLFIETHSMFRVIVLVDDLNIVFSLKDFNDMHFIFLAHKKSGMKIPPGFARFLEFLSGSLNIILPNFRDSIRKIWRIFSLIQ